MAAISFFNDQPVVKNIINWQLLTEYVTNGVTTKKGRQP